MTTQEKIDTVCSNFATFLKEKNKRYGDSAIAPINIFCKGSETMPENSICVRLNDKIGRILQSEELRKNDISDCIGYLILLCISKDWIDFNDLLD
jgi:hypothetical protein